VVIGVGCRNDATKMHDAVAILNRVQRYKKYLEYANFRGQKYLKKAKGEGFQERGGRMLSGKNNETKGRL